jgi:hypothetical protein
MLKEIIFATLAAIFLPSMLTAQQRYIEVIFKTNAGKSISGKILSDTWNSNPTSLKVVSADETSQTYNVADIESFEVMTHNGERLYYEREDVKIEMSPISINELDSESTLKYQYHQAWLQLVYSGTWKLYRMNDITGKTHWLLNTGLGEIEELVSKAWISPDLNSQQIRTIELYKKQLSEFGNGCEEVQRLLNHKKFTSPGRLDLSMKALIEVCEAYDECKKADPIYYAPIERGQFDWRLIAGWHTGGITFEPEYDFSLNGLNGPHFGFAIDYYFSNISKRISIKNELIAYYDEGPVTIISGSTNLFRTDVDYKSWQILLSNIASLKVWKSPYAPSVMAGLSHRFQPGTNISAKYGLVQFFENANTSDISNLKNFYELGVIAGVSAEFKKFGLSINYHLTSKPIFGGIGDVSNSKTFTVHLSYRIN